MAQKNGRIDRFAQMNKQEELIAKKRQEILEKQRTVQLARAVAAAQNLAKQQNEAVSFSSNTEEERDNTSKKDEDLLQDVPAKSTSSLIGKIKSSLGGGKRGAGPIPKAQHIPPKIQNYFCNDGTFLDHFKKILEKHEQPKPLAILETSVTQAATEKTASKSENVEPLTELASHKKTAAINVSIQHQPQLAQPSQLQPPAQFTFDSPNMLQKSSLPPQLQIKQTASQQSQPASQQQIQQSSPMLSFPPVPPPVRGSAPPVYFTSVTQQQISPPQIPPPPPSVSSTAVPLMGLPSIANTPPPPPPPPQLPMALANMAQLYMIPTPEPLQLNAIPAPKEFDLNVIPTPKLNLEVIKMSTEQQLQQSVAQQQSQLDQQNMTQKVHQNHIQQQEMHQHIHQQQNMQEQRHLQQQQMQQQQPKVFSDINDQCLGKPTTVESLIALVADHGDDYEDKICSRKNDLHPNLWFLFDKSSEQYHNYRQQLSDCLHNKQQQPQINTNPPLKKEEELPCALSEKDTAEIDVYDPESVISGDIDSDDEYMRGMMDRNRNNIKRRIECRNELSEEEPLEEERNRLEKKKFRKSRWGDKVDISKDTPNSSSSGVFGTFANQYKPVITKVSRSDPQLLQYASLNYGSVNLSEEDWRKCEEHYKVNLLYQDMIQKRQEIDRLARSGKFKYEYDSDEDVDGGTWEHKLRCAEMEATQAWAQALTKQSEGKHHIGDFLPPEELKKFMEQYDAKKNNRQPDLSDYKEYKLKEDNIGFQMLQKLGWKEGQGLGTGGEGIVNPVNKAPQREGNQGLGVVSAAAPENCDNEYDAYRKRMMLAYRFRPNPLNNPRRAYY